MSNIRTLGPEIPPGQGYKEQVLYVECIKPYL